MPNRFTTYTAFAGERRIGTGSIQTVALLAWAKLEAEPGTTILFFDDETGRELDLDLRGSEAEVLARLAVQFPQTDESENATSAESTAESTAQAGSERTRGRPKLGVIAREVTLLPRHWDWLNGQPGSASVALRKLVDAARHANAGRDERQRSQKAAFVFMSAMAGDRPHFEEASRALFAGERGRFEQCIDAWPADIREHARHLARPAFEQQ